MPGSVALLVWFVLLLVLLRWSKDRKNSPALWLPVTWLLIISSRTPSQWLGLTPTSAATAFEDGSALDRAIFLTLAFVAFWVLTSRQINWTELFGRNAALMLLIVFALASVAWSDFPYVTFKRWIRDLGTYVMVLVVVSDPRPVVAISTVIRRFSYILLGVSLLLIKYYPQMGVLYNSWSGAPEYLGATTSKNMLGVLCLIGGMYFFWDTLGRWHERKAPEVKRVLFANILFLGITLRLLMLSDSATSKVCLVMGCLLITMLRLRWVKAHPRIVTAAIPLTLAGYAFMEFVFDLSS